MNENHTQVRNFERYFVMLTSGQFWWNHIDRETSRGFRPSIMKAVQRETLLKIGTMALSIRSNIFREARLTENHSHVLRSKKVTRK